MTSGVFVLVDLPAGKAVVKYPFRIDRRRIDVRHVSRLVVEVVAVAQESDHDRRDTTTRQLRRSPRNQCSVGVTPGGIGVTAIGVLIGVTE